MNKLLLVDVDSKIPNIALMKIAQYYKNSYEIILKKLNLSYYPNKKNIVIDGFGYDKIFVSIIFTPNKNKVKIINNNNVGFGGTGYSLSIKLSKEIENSKCDYSIYPDNDYSYGFITRGCIRNCKFCFVPKKEGYIHKVNNIQNIVQHNKVKFLDNNILAYNKHKEILQELINKKIKCQFNQGLDIRLINPENAKLLSQLRYLGEYIFAFDNIKDVYIINKKLEIVKQFIVTDWKLKFFLYCLPSMDIQKDIKYRIEWCKQNKVLPYLMRDLSCWESKYNHFYIDLAAWCNQPGIFKKMDFREFLNKRHTKIDRINNSLKLYYKEKL